MPWTLNLVMSMSPFVAGKLSPGKTPWMLRAAGPSISSRSALVAQASRSAINNVNLNEKLRWRANQKSQSDSDNKLGMRNNAFSSGPPAEEEYKVGPGRPPKEHQFKPGQSGNPTGAKRKAPSLLPDLKEQFERAFNQTTKVTQGERERVITMWAAGMQQLSVQFAKGDRYARRDAFWIAEKLGSEFLTSKKAFDEILAGDRQAILDAFVARQTHRKVSAAPSPVFAPPELLDDDTPDEADEM